MLLGELSTIEFIILIVAVFVFISALVTSVVSFFEKEHLAALAEHKTITQARYYCVHDKLVETDLG